MKIGKKYGKETVYGPRGGLIVRGDEKVQFERDNVYLEVYERGPWGILNEKKVFDWGVGKLYKTDKRVVFIREPIKRVQQLYHYGGFFPFAGPMVLSTSEEENKKDLKQYVEFGTDEILKWDMRSAKEHKIKVKARGKSSYLVHLKVGRGIKTDN